MMRVKICGITRPEDAELVCEAGADAIGLVFYPPSRRHLDDLQLAADIARACAPFVTVTGLFVDPEPGLVEKVLNRVPLGLLQFHGDESPELCRRFDRPYIKAVRMKEGVDLAAVAAEHKDASALLLDTYVQGVPGGTGAAFNWDRVPAERSKPVVLAGGLNADNVAEAIGIAQPDAVDVSGGVESAPGIKDPERVSAFIRHARQAQ